MRIRPSVAARIVLLGFLAVVAWGLQKRVAEAQQGIDRTLGLDAIEIAIGGAASARPER